MTELQRYTREFARRERMLSCISEDREKQNALKVHYRNYPVDFIQDWLITVDPRNSFDPNKTPFMPFLLYPKQIEFILWLRKLLELKRSGLVEKSRDAGATWLGCAFDIWGWLFLQEAAFGWGSRKEELVDNLNDPKSIFEKIRMLVKYLPRFLIPVGFDMKKHATYMKLYNPANGSTIIGEAGDNIGRGARTLMYKKDESAHYEHAESIAAALSETTDIQVDISSVRGANNLFYRKRFSGEVEVFIFDWRDTPWKTQEWYDRKRKEAESQGILFIFSQEIDRNYNAAVDMIVIHSDWVDACIDAHIAIGWDPEGEIVSGLDVADEGGDLNAQAIRKGNVYFSIEAWGEGDTGKTAIRAHRKCLNSGVQRLRYDSVGVGAGVKAKLNEINPDYLVEAFKGGAAVRDPFSDYVEGVTNKDMFENLKAQAWWDLRVKCEKTYKVRNGLDFYPVEELVSFSSSIPDIHKLKAELSQPTYALTKIGKIIINKKPNGTQSPNRADAVVMCDSQAEIYLDPYV